MMLKRYSRNPFFLLLWAVFFLLLTPVPGYCLRVALTTIFVEPCISTCQGLQDMQNDLAADYCLAKDIECGMTNPANPSWKVGGTWGDMKGFAPVGKDHDNKFTGSFDGRGHKIENLYINRPSTFIVGLFGSILGDIKDVGLKDVNIKGGENTGSLVGWNNATITNSYSTGVVIGSNKVGGLAGNNAETIINSYSTAKVTGDREIGGLVGANWFGTIINSHSTGSVSGNNTIGGLAGWTGNGMIENSYSTGAVTGIVREIGGLAGANHSTIKNSYSTGVVNGVKYTGGLVGWNTGSVTNSYATGDVNSSLIVGGLVADNQGPVTNSYATGSVNGIFRTGGLVGWNWNGGTVTNSYWDTQTSGRGASDGGTGKTTIQMKQEATYHPIIDPDDPTDPTHWWDFTERSDDGNEDIWKIDENISYPYFN